MSKLLNIMALIGSPASIYLNLDAYMESMQFINLLLAIIVALVSLVVMYYVIKKRRLEIRKLERDELEYEDYCNECKRALDRLREL